MLILGVDEVGRGCLAGPVVACACLLKEGFESSEIVDSKKLLEKKRKFLSEYIKEN
ncbi:MAG: ribonuclease HII, partial [Deferribacterales bacterium]|nr:ribonuclease HII [Deferribacterales bacterium]